MQFGGSLMVKMVRANFTALVCGLFSMESFLSYVWPIASLFKARKAMSADIQGGIDSQGLADI